MQVSAFSVRRSGVDSDETNEVLGARQPINVLTGILCVG